MKTKKGQAAMEYLMTYGWAILAIIIVIAALIYLNPFRAPELCLFQQQGFSCSEPNPTVYLKDGGVTMSVRIWNKLGRTIIIQKVLCTTAQTAQVGSDDAGVVDAEEVMVPTGTHVTFSSTGQGPVIPCYNSEGNEVVLAPNQEFRGRLIVWYNYEDDIEDIYHEAQANVISLVVANSTG